MMLYRMKLKPIFKIKPWSGRRLQTYFGKKIPKGNIGESWELCCREDGMSIVGYGQYRGKTWGKLISIFRERLLGPSIFAKYGAEFPLLFKILDANDRLSVQVHPDDACAKSSSQAGKTKCGMLLTQRKCETYLWTEKGHFRSKIRKRNQGKPDFAVT